MMVKRITCRLSAGIFVLLALAVFSTAAFAAKQPALTAFESRMKTFKAEIPAIVASAEKSAAIMLAHPDALLNVPYWEQMSFSEELINRAGGLTSATNKNCARTAPTKNDIVLLSVRSWEKQSDLICKRVREYQAKGWTVTVFGSRAGKPERLGADFFVDNGAPTGGAEHGRINVLANVTLGWMWCCEYASAMSRQGKFPAVLLSVGVKGGAEYDAKIQTPAGRHTLIDCPKAVRRGELAKFYLKRIGKMIDDLESRRVQRQLKKAADLMAKRIADGRMVGIAGMGHSIVEEVRIENAAPLNGFRAVFNSNIAIRAHLRPGDLLVWMSYCGMNSAYEDYGKNIADAKVDLITSYAFDPEWSKNPPPTLAHIDQGWKLPDAEVPIPVYPDAMAPISGQNVTILARMLDDEVAARLKKIRKKKEPASPLPMSAEYMNTSERAYPYDDDYAPTPVRKWGFINAAGMEVGTKNFDNVSSVAEGLAAVCENGKWGYVDENGTQVIAPAYDKALAFSGGAAIVGIEGKFGLIDKTGKVILPLEYDQLDEPYRLVGAGYAVARLGSKWGIVGKSGKVLIEPEYDMIYSYSEKAVIAYAADKCSLVSIAGEEIVAPKYKQIWGSRQGYGWANLDGKWGIIDDSGKVIIEPKYDDLSDLLGDMALVMVDGKIGCVNSAGVMVIPPKYSSYRDSSGGMWRVQLGSKWGYVDKTGTEVIEPKYDVAGEFSGGYATVQRDGKWYVIDIKGTEKDFSQYDFIAIANEGLFKVVRDGKWGFIDGSGNEIVPPKYTFVLKFNKGKALVVSGGNWSDKGITPLVEGGKWGVVDATGKEVVPPQFDRVIPSNEGLQAIGTVIEEIIPQP